MLISYAESDMEFQINKIYEKNRFCSWWNLNLQWGSSRPYPLDHKGKWLRNNHTEIYVLHERDISDMNQFERTSLPGTRQKPSGIM